MFKVGDVVKCVRGYDEYLQKGKDFVITELCPDYRTVKIEGYYGYWDENRFELINRENEGGEFIVIASVKNGITYSPSERPFVHTTRSAAEKEAKRLAGIHTSQSFAVFELGKKFKAEITVKELPR